MIRLKAAYQTYEWGKLGNESKVATMLSAGDQSINIDPKSPYAELWMGTHPKGSSLIASTGQQLSAWLADHVSYVGENLKSAIDANNKQLDLPFLFKVLSVNKALSIQVHPNKDEAVILHEKDPKNYPDPNHKPEMAIALSPFELLCSFRPLHEIMQNLEATPELVALVGNDCVTQLRQVANANVPESKRKEALKICFSNLLTQSEQRVAAEMDKLLKRVVNAEDFFVELQTSTNATNGSVGLVNAELLHRLNKHFPRDVGCWAPFFLNHFCLQPGEAVFLGANEAHAYLFGDCIECMACSDNTVRAGLTPKFKDVQNLCRMLTYRTVSPKEIKLIPKQDKGKYLTIYDPPVKEFCVHRIEVPRKENYVLDALNTCSIVLVVEGCADVAETETQKLTSGFIGLLPAKMSLKITVKTAPFVMFQSFAKD
ncbi:mannose 6 phosphate isomerase [Trichuris trichiura]|uniref:Mannose-6-phosphate isomerase n=1 Tax=Trichuris trichiura TaxID=36087 RepID=A0A077Z8R6_TRITR|nr:mannose 6 phosphate isomerase [Trichuris trichiura]